MEDLLDAGLEVTDDGNGRRKGGVVLALLDGVDALPGHTQGGAELGLGRASGLAQAAHAVIHDRIHDDILPIIPVNPLHRRPPQVTGGLLLLGSSHVLRHRPAVPARAFPPGTIGI